MSSIKSNTSQKHIKIISESILFDEPWYLENYKDVASSSIPAAEHYYWHGASELRNPSKNFDTAWYLTQYPDVKSSGMNALIHFVEHGEKEGRSALPFCVERLFMNNIPTEDTISNTLELQRTIDARNQELIKLQKQLQYQQVVIDGLRGEFQQLLKQSHIERQTLLTELRNQISTSINNSTQQIENFISLNNYLYNGVLPLGFHGWPISPDIGLHIVNIIDQHPIDLIVEFGSGTSTVMMAQALKMKSQTTINADTSKRPQIISFDHHEKYYLQTKLALRRRNLDEHTRLILAPLVNYQLDGKQYRYYDCAETLKELEKETQNKVSTIVVLVDGPPGSTNHHARLPAIPHLLTLIKNHHTFIIVDDFSREEEREIVANWISIFDENNINYHLSEIPTEKGMAVIELNKP